MISGDILVLHSVRHIKLRGSKRGDVFNDRHGRDGADDDVHIYRRFRSVERQKRQGIVHLCYRPLFTAKQNSLQIARSAVGENSEKMKLLVVYLVFVATISVATGQNPTKPGSCSPALSVQFCGHSCFVDSHCTGIGKCCPTQCGGSICTMPVTLTRSSQPEKSGYCPSKPTGRWVCSSTCSNDSDCKGNLKCCKNRCGAQVCQKPEIEKIEPEENPVEPVFPRFGFDY